ncbi:GerMN domain-containing protein [Arthrobacter sp. SDTb3-6]|uniref:GerMN domain-containing protein n=1 Tax=Arthrobacter sp. SDTb3-6 TaxID=2713571 RepID=UPI00159CF3D7|nr:GerMN domain-containing protein [Arthrobacter sp. SDTb3-6]NVM97958.1 GerMN domain-containing protein [Arthrobacter sp. SDTb3-6]
MPEHPRTPRPHAPVPDRPVRRVPAGAGRRAGLAAAVVAATLMASGCAAGVRNANDTVMPTTAGTRSTSQVTSAPLETPAATQTIPVYWLGHSNNSVYLYREFLPSPTTDEPIVAALQAMMTRSPKDPDYFSVWKKPSRLAASISAKNVITVDVSADAFGQAVDAGIARRSVSQLVYTATASAAMAGLINPDAAVQVSILVDGHTGFNAFGHVVLDKPQTRDPALVAPVWIIDPGNGATSHGLPLKVDGQGISPSGSLSWSLSAVTGGKAGGVYQSGTVRIPKGPGQLGAFSFTVVPPLGTYQVSVFIADPSVPGGQVGVDSKVVTLSGPTASPAAK